MVNKLMQNRKSPKNESECIKTFKKLNPSAKKADGMDISAGKTKDGTLVHGLMKTEHNRSRDRDFHRGQDVTTDIKLKKAMKPKK